MPRSGSGEYSKPPGTTAEPGTVIASATFNAAIDDLAAMQNEARPLTAGGTGGTSQSTAQASLGLVPQTNTADTTAGRLMLNGAHGLGAATAPAMTGGDANLAAKTGVFRTDDTTANAPWAPSFGIVLNLTRNSGSRTLQIGGPTGNATSERLFYRQQSSTDGWGDWLHIRMVTDSDSGSNGRYVKYSDGLIECWNKIEWNGAINTAFKGGFRSAVQTWTFPTAFGSAPTDVQVSVGSASAASAYINAAPSTTQATFTAWCGATEGAADRTLYVYARGY